MLLYCLTLLHYYVGIFAIVAFVNTCLVPIPDLELAALKQVYSICAFVICTGVTVTHQVSLPPHSSRVSCLTMLLTGYSIVPRGVNERVDGVL